MTRRILLYEADEITEEVISKILEEIPQGLNIYLYLDPYGEVDQLEVNCDGEWLAIGLSLHGGTKEEKNYYSYNPEYAGVEEFAHVQAAASRLLKNTLRLPIWKLA